MDEVGTVTGSNRYDPRDGGGRTASGTAVESRVWNGDREQRRMPKPRMGWGVEFQVCLKFLSHPRVKIINVV